MKKKYDDDDGRTIADMSGLERRPLILPKPGIRRRQENTGMEYESLEEVIADPGENISRKKSPVGEDMNREERHAAMSGALAAGLLIAGAIIVGLLIIILIFTSFGK